VEHLYTKAVCRRLEWVTLSGSDSDWESLK